MARKPSRGSIAGGNFDKIIESRGGIDRKVAKKIATARQSALLRGNPATPETVDKIRETMNTVLTDKQHAFVANKVDMGMSDNRAAKEAGYSDKAAARNLNTLPKIQNAIAERQEAYQEVVQMSRKRVMDGLLEAVDMAKLKADPLSMVAGWREIAKICGYYEPTKVQVDVSVNGKMLLHQMSSMSQEDLLKLADMGDALEGEFQEIDE